MNTPAGDSVDRDERLGQVVAAIFEETDRGQRPDRDLWLARHPDLAGDLADLFGALDHVAPYTAPLSAAAPPHLARGTVRAFGEYELVEEVARGGMGVVYKAWQPSVKRTVALKMLAGGALAAPAEVQRFRTEAEAAATLDHPGIVPLYEVGEREGRHFFTMKWLDGGSLSQAVAGEKWAAAGKEPGRRAAEMVAAVARAVHHAHQRGILHRDLKPSNILLDAEGRPHVADFGLAKLLDADSRLTQTGLGVGTPSYMAPEQAGGKRGTVTTATDVYGLGAVLYALLTGRPPFRGTTVLETLEQVKGREPEPAGRINPKVDRDLETVCLKCLEKEAGRRYGSAEALAEELERWLKGEPIQARPVRSWERFYRWCRRNPGLATTGSLAAAALVMVVALAVGFALYQRQAAEDLRAEQGKTADALKDSQAALQVAQTERDRADQMNVNLFYQQGLTLCNIGDVRRGMLWLARSLEHARPADADFQRVLRADLTGWSSRLQALRLLISHPGTYQNFDSVPLQGVAFSPNGRWIVTCGDDQTARIWEARTGRAVGDPLSHRSEVRSVAVSPDGKTILTGLADGTACLWDTATRKLRAAPLRHGDGDVGTLAFNPDSQIALTGGEDKTAQLWGVNTGQKIGLPLRHEGAVRAVAFSPQGNIIATAGDDKRARFWDTTTGKAVGDSIGHDSAVTAITFSPDGKTLVTGTAIGQVRFWKIATREFIGKTPDHQGPVTAVAYSSDGNSILTGSSDHTARLWDVDSRQALGEPIQHRGDVRGVAFSPDGSEIASASVDGTAQVWTVPGRHGGSLVQYPHTFVVGAVAFSPDGRTIATAGGIDLLPGGGRVQLWETATARPLFQPITLPFLGFAVAFSPNGTQFVTGCGSPYVLNYGEARLWEAQSGKPASPPLPHPKAVFSVAFHPKNPTFLTGCFDGKARLWDTTKSAPIQTLPHRKEVLAVAFSPDGREVLTGSSDKSARLWHVATGQTVGKPLAHQASVSSVAFSPDGRFFLTGCADYTAQLWDARTGENLRRSFQHKNWLRRVAFSPDGQTILTASLDNTARLWDRETGKPIGPPLQHDDWVPDAAFSPDGKTVLTGSKDKTARLWEVPVPLDGTPERITLWVQVITKMELDESGTVHALDGPTWAKRLQRLEKLGGPVK